MEKRIISKPAPFLQVIRNKPLKKYKTDIKEWLKPVIDLSEFHVYPMNGITEGLNYWMLKEKRDIYREKGDYEWVEIKDKWQKAFGKTDYIHYLSCPSSIDGNFREIPRDVPVALDLAYVGSTPIEKIEVTPNIEYVFYGLSKPFGLNGVRTGWFFTRRPDIKLHRLLKLNYYNHIAHAVAEEMIKQYSIDFIYNTYRSEQERVCDQYNLLPSDCVWIGTSSDPVYNDFIRATVARLCLTEYYDNKPYI